MNSNRFTFQLENPVSYISKNIKMNSKLKEKNRMITY